MRAFFFTSILVLWFTTSCTNLEEDRKLIEVAEFDNSMAIGLSVNSKNKTFVSFPNSDGDGDLALTLIHEGELIPFPNIEWNTAGDYDHHFLRIQDLYVDAEDFLWVLDSKPGASGNIFASGTGETEGLFKLVKINTKTNRVEDIYFFEGLDKSKSALNDVRVDTDKKVAYLSDPGLASIVVLDLQTKRIRTVLAQTPYTLADNITLEYDGVKMQNAAGKSFSSNVNSIALTQDFKYLYFKPINKRNLYRIDTKYLASEELTDGDLGAKVEDLGEVGITHGMIADAHGNVYFSSSEDFNISYITPDGQLRVLVKDPQLIWADSFGISPDGYLHFTCAQLQRLPEWNNGVDKTDYPYKAFKVKLPN